MMNKCNLVELFSGIGSQYRALKNLGIEVNTLGTSEWNVHAIVAYDVIHNATDVPEEITALSKEQLLNVLKQYTFSNSGKEALDYSSFKSYSKETLERIYLSITRNRNYVDISEMSGKDLPGDIDILTYSFPCQDLSNVGAFHGYNKGIDKGSGSRSSLLWQVGRILTEMHNNQIALPRFLLMENVPTLLSDRHRDNFKEWISDLEQLGYVSKHFELNASSFGLPQNRPRLLMISVYVGDSETKKRIVKSFFELKDKEDIVSDYGKSKYYRKFTVQDLLRINYQDYRIKEEAVESTPNDTISRRKIWDENPQIIKEGNIYNKEIDMIRTITTKQDRNPNSGNLYFDSGIEGKSKFRYLTPRECLLFMGFTDSDYENLVGNNVIFHEGNALFTRDKIIRMAGNSIPVKLLEGIFLQIIQLDELLSSMDTDNEQMKVSDAAPKVLSDVIRKYMFSRGIRSRLNDLPYPTSADVVYPKYKTAIYFLDYFENGSESFRNNLSEQSRSVWKGIFNLNEKKVQERYQSALDLGWDVILVWKDEIYNGNNVEMLKWIESVLHKNRNQDAVLGEVIVCD